MSNIVSNIQCVEREGKDTLYRQTIIKETENSEFEILYIVLRKNPKNGLEEMFREGPLRFSRQALNDFRNSINHALQQSLVLDISQ